MFVCHPNLLANQQCIQLIGSALYQDVADSDSSSLLFSSPLLPLAQVGLPRYIVCHYVMTYKVASTQSDIGQASLYRYFQI